ncbi:MAG: penicillin-binding transpeptidase domain-containing protein, partial [Microthrixaceae bacterium]
AARNPAARKPAARKPAPRKPAARKPAARKPAPTRSTSRNRSTRPNAQLTQRIAAGNSPAETQQVRQRVKVLVGVFCVLALLPLIKLVSVQLGSGAELAARGESQRVKTVVLPAERGSILDRTGAELAISLPRYRVVVNMKVLASHGISDLSSFERFASRLAPVIRVDQAELLQALQGAEPSDPWVPLAERVSIEDAERAVALLKEDKFENILTLENSSERVHPAGDSALRVLGTLGPDGPGKLAGIERAFDSELQGKPGKKVLELGSEGQSILGGEHLLEKPTAGSSIQLTIDRAIQHETERLLAEGAISAGAHKGIAIIGRPGTGEVLAVASVERDSKTSKMELSSGPIAFSNSYQAGSVFKLVTVAAAVESGQVTPETVLEVPYRIQVADKVFSDHEAHPTEPMTVKEILAQSSNVGTIKVALGLGKQSLHDALTGFGFGSSTGSGHPAEASGIVPRVSDWTTPDLAASAIGTHQSATAMQVWAAYNVIANGGRYVAPRLVGSVVAADGSRTSPPTKPSREVISTASAAQVSEMLQQVVRDGTGKQWSIPGYPIAAKTGTSRMAAQTQLDKKDGYAWSDGRYHYLAAFTGFLPADRPQVSITVILEDITPGLTGSSAAGPVFSDLAHLSIRELGIAPTSQESNDDQIKTGSETPSSSAASPPSTTVIAGTIQDANGRVRAQPAGKLVRSTGTKNSEKP